jgi:hypothetical protein
VLIANKGGHMGRVQRLGILIIVLVFGALVGLRPAAAQSKEARGTVTAVSDSSLTVKVGAQDMTFAVDGKTAVLARGAGRATRDAQATGAPGIKIGDAIKPGGAVIVQYTEAGGKRTATEVRAVSDAGAAGGSVSRIGPWPCVQERDWQGQVGDRRLARGHGRQQGHDLRCKP